MSAPVPRPCKNRGPLVEGWRAVCTRPSGHEGAHEDRDLELQPVWAENDAPAPRNHPAEAVKSTTIHGVNLIQRQVVAATVIAVYDDGTTEVHSVARGSKNTKLTIDLSEEA